jgi:hypothetical protein
MGDAQMSVPKHLAVVTVVPDQEPPVAVEVTVDIIREELSLMIPGHAWNVRRISSTEFVVAFPSAEILSMCTFTTSTFTLPTHKIQVTIKPSKAAPETRAVLSDVWIRIIGMPDEAKNVPMVKLISQAIGKYVEVDLSSLVAGSEAVRLRVLCQDPEKVPGTLPMTYFGPTDGRILIVQLDEGSSLPPPPPRPAHSPRMAH